MTSLDITSPDRSSARRLDWGAWAVLVLAVGYIAGAVIYVLLAFQQPTDGWLYTAGVSATVSAVRNQSGRPSPLHVGDQFVAVNGAPAPSLTYRPLPPPAGWELGGSVRYTVVRDGATIDLQAPMTTRPASELLWYMLGTKDGAPLRLLSALSWYLLGFGVFLLRPQSTAARLLLLIAVYWATSNIIINADTPVSIAFYAPPLFWMRFGTELLWPMLFTMALHLTLAFPVRTWPLARWPGRTLALLYGLPTLGVTLGTIFASDALALGSMFLMMILLIISILATTIINLRRAHDPVVLAQVRWVSLGLLIPFVSAIVIQSALALHLIPEALRVGGLLDLAGVISTLLLPLCLGIAITRYRLFDIDIILRRTLVYTALTITLGAIYLAGVALLQTLLAQLIGQGSSLVVAGSTLTIAALFQPLRARIQATIDRRFFRKKYDASQVLAAFAQRAQQAADLDTLSADMLGVVQETLEPERARFWIFRRP